MSEKIKVNNVWKNIAAIYKKVSGGWVLQENSILDIVDQMIYFYQGHINNATLDILGESAYTGKSFLLTCKLGTSSVHPTWTIISGSQYASINENGKVTIIEGAENNTIVVRATYRNETIDKTITVSYDNQLTIEGSDTITGTAGNVIAKYNSTVVDPIWSITDGQAYGTIDSSGNITVIGSGSITVTAAYNNYTATKNISLIYDSNSSSTTEVDPETGTTTTTTTTTTTDPETGTTTETTNTTIINDDGSSSNTSTETNTNADGSSTTTSSTTNSDGTSSTMDSSTSAPDPVTGSTTTNTNTINYDENGDTTGSSTNQTVNNTDGSSTSSTTNYNAEGDPTDQQNIATDTTGNVDTQDVEFNENGDPTVTGYTIDTEASDGSGKDLTGNGVDTEFIPFGFVEGFTMHLRFRTTAEEQPNPPIVPDTEDIGTNYLYNIMSAKSTTKVGNIWPGFDIRWAVSKSGSTSSATLQFRRTLVGETSS